MRHADWQYVMMGTLLLVPSFAIIIIAFLQGRPQPTEPWLMVWGIAAHWFGRANGSRSGMEKRTDGG